MELNYYHRRRRKNWVKLLRIQMWLPIFAVAMLVGLSVLYGFVARGDAAQTARYRLHVAQANKQIESIFRTLQRRQPRPQMGPAPDVVWEGADARILLRDSSVDPKRVHTRDTAYWSFVAMTPSGRFFSARYELWRSSECSVAIQCVSLSIFKVLSPEEAKEVIFAAGNKNLYEELFEEPMPPLEVKA
jgi:hypothetical protein